MLVGKGLIARAFADLSGHRHLIVFASGVSNSLETRQSEFEREEKLLRDSLATSRGRMIYFSTTNVLDHRLKDVPYVRHKQAMEQLIRDLAESHQILRLPQVVGMGAKAATVVEYFYCKIISGDPFDIWGKAKRRLIDIDDVSRVARHFIGERDLHRETIDFIPPVGLTALEIVAELEAVTGKKANYRVIEKGSEVEFDSEQFVAAANALGIVFDDEYPRRIIRKYYSTRNERQAP